MMKQWVIAGLLAGSIGVAGAAAQQTTTQKPSGQTTTGQTTTGTTTQGTGQKATGTKSPGQQPSATGSQTGTAEQGTTTTTRRARRAAAGGETVAGHTAPKEQPKTADEPNAPTEPMALGRVHIPGGVTADGKPLPAGVYDVRLTADEAKPNAVGTSEKLERWVEFVQRGSVKGREVVSIVPQNEIKLVQKDAPPRSGSSKVERLKGGEYVRVWINKAGNHYLIHLPTGTAAPAPTKG